MHSSRLATMVALSMFAAGEVRAQTLLWKHGTKVADLDRMGDFDGDGVPDVVIIDGSTPTPVVVSGKDGSVLKTYSQTALHDSSVAGIGDQDGDGVPDLLLGDPFYFDVHGNAVGQVTGISGASGSAFYSYVGWDRGSAGSEFYAGICVRGMGDANNDGLPDFGFGIWSRPGFVVGPSIVMQRFNGGASGVDVALNWEFDTSFAFPIHTLAPIGDVDGDGASDFAASFDDSGTGIGSVEVHSGMSGGLIRTIKGAAKREHFGAALGSCGDQDGDGVRELLIGAPGHFVGGLATGRVLICSGATGALLRTLDGEFDQQQFGYDMDGLDDVDGDGVGDFAIQSYGTHGRVQVFSGATGAELQRIEGESAARLRDVGDLDGDGHDDLAVSNWLEVHAWKVAPFLAIESVTPARIRYDQVGTLAIHGGGFTADPGLVVLVDGAPATAVNVSSYTDLTCSAPALLPGPHDVTVSDQFGAATLAGGLVLTPAVFVDGVATLGSTVDLRYEFDALDSSFAIFGLPPQVAIPTPPYGGLLGIVPFTPFFLQTAWPSDEYIVHANIPNDPALSGVTVLFQSLTGPQLTGHGKDAAWSNVAALAIQ